MGDSEDTQRRLPVNVSRRQYCRKSPVDKEEKGEKERGPKGKRRRRKEKSRGGGGETRGGGREEGERKRRKTQI